MRESARKLSQEEEALCPLQTVSYRLAYITFFIIQHGEKMRTLLLFLFFYFPLTEVATCSPRLPISCNPTIIMSILHFGPKERINLFNVAM